MKRLSLLSLIFAFLSLVFFLLLVFLRTPFVGYPLMSWQDALDVITPLALIPTYWLMYRGVTRGRNNLIAEIAFLIMSAFWVMGQGMHLSANSINNLAGYLTRDGIIEVGSTDLNTLIYFYDEYLSHYLWHIGVVGLASLLIYESWRYPAEEKTNWGLVIPAGIIYGFTCFCFFLEGNTVILGLPFVLAVTFLVLVWGRSLLVQQPVLSFFFVSCCTALVLMLGWRLYYGCFCPIMEMIHF